MDSNSTTYSFLFAFCATLVSHTLNPPLSRALPASHFRPATPCFLFFFCADAQTQTPSLIFYSSPWKCRFAVTCTSSHLSPLRLSHVSCLLPPLPFCRATILLHGRLGLVLARDRRSSVLGKILFCSHRQCETDIVRCGVGCKLCLVVYFLFCLLFIYGVLNEYHLSRQATLL